MTMVVEDGTGLANANSYAAVADADAFFADRLDDDWDGSDAEKEVALIRGTDYIENRYGQQFRGSPLVATQALAFPRANAYDRYGNKIDGVPTRLQQAVFFLAKRAILEIDLTPDPTVSTEGSVVRKKQKLGALEQELEFSESQAGSVRLPTFPEADRLLLPMLSGGSQGSVYR